MSDRATLKAFFETGDFPTEAQFADWLDSVTLPTKTTKTFSDFQPNATATSQITLFSGVAGSVPTLVKVKHSTSFTGGATAGAVISVQDSNNNNLIAGIDVFTAPGDTVGGYANVFSNTDIPDQVAASNYEVTLFIGGDIIDNLTAGSVDIWVMELPLI